MGLILNRRREMSGAGENYLLHLEKDLTDKSPFNRITQTTGSISCDSQGIFINGTSSPSALILDSGIKNAILNKDFSISMDIYITSKVQIYANFLSLGGSNTDGGVIGFQLESGSGIYFYANGMKINYDNRGFSYNHWYNTEFKRENGVFSLYLDGVLKGTSNYHIQDNIRDLVIGYNQSAPSERIVGYVKNIYIKLLSS